MEEGRTIKYKINVKGFPVIDLCYVFKESNGIVALAIQTKTKWCECCGYGDGYNGEPSIYLVGCGEGSLHGRKNKKYDEITEVLLPEFKGWDIWSIGCGKYTIPCCLVDTREK